MLNNAGLKKYEISNFARDVSIVAIAICSPFLPFEACSSPHLVHINSLAGILESA